MLEVLGLVREQGWLADRALEVVLRRQKRLYSSERRAAAEGVYGVLRSQGRLEWMLGRRPGIAELYGAFLAVSGPLPSAQAERRLGLDRGLLSPLAGAEARIQAIVQTWPVRFRTELALAMGFQADADVTSVIRDYIRDENITPA